MAVGEVLTGGWASWHDVFRAEALVRPILLVVCGRFGVEVA